MTSPRASETTSEPRASATRSSPATRENSGTRWRNRTFSMVVYISSSGSMPVPPVTAQYRA
ncbi:hypothetical protein BE04_20910 [Sorangium cellulosum]|uniref:Uncharacterized protein n=1 Tax=Sorangium cellulosum TaxID=56 RepID=A0A150PIP5_SORCE|nr:hypothetical protein BE04_20910 [Sorangium cellulosum]